MICRVLRRAGHPLLAKAFCIAFEIIFAILIVKDGVYFKVVPFFRMNRRIAPKSIISFDLPPGSAGTQCASRSSRLISLIPPQFICPPRLGADGLLSPVQYTSSLPNLAAESRCSQMQRIDRTDNEEGVVAECAKV